MRSSSANKDPNTSAGINGDRPKKTSAVRQNREKQARGENKFLFPNSYSIYCMISSEELLVKTSGHSVMAASGGKPRQLARYLLRDEKAI